MKRTSRVVITGAGGFVGRALALGFAGLDWRVTALDRWFDDDGRATDVDLPGPGIHRITADVAEGIPADVPAADLVVHAAWTTTDALTLGITPAEHVAQNLRPLVAVLEYAARTQPAAFVFVSSSGVFAPEDATDGLTDAHRPTGSSPYAAGKRAGELLVPAALSSGVTAVHVVRLGHLFGPDEVARPSRQDTSLVARGLADARRGGPLEVRSDDPRRDWTFTSDLAAALERLVKSPPAGHPVHLGSPYVYRDRELAAHVASFFPETATVTVPVSGPVKPPMVPSDIPALRGFKWTDLSTGLRVLLAEEVAAT